MDYLKYIILLFTCFYTFAGTSSDTVIATKNFKGPHANIDSIIGTISHSTNSDNAIYSDTCRASRISDSTKKSDSSRAAKISDSTKKTSDSLNLNSAKIGRAWIDTMKKVTFFDTSIKIGGSGISNTPKINLLTGTGHKLYWYDDLVGSNGGTKMGIYIDQFSLTNNSTLVFSTAIGDPGSFIIASKRTGIYDTVLTDRFRILGESGFVGIGTNPTKKLTVSGGGQLDTLYTSQSYSIRDTAQVMKADSGNFGALVYQGIYGDIHRHDTTTTQTIATGATYTILTCLESDGPCYRVTCDTANDRLIILQNGTYRLSFHLSFGGTVNSSWRTAAFVNETEQESIHIRRKLSAAGDVGDAGATGMVVISNAPDTVTLRARHDQVGNADISVNYANLNVNYVSK